MQCNSHTQLKIKIVNMILFRSACQSPERAMSLVSAAEMIPGYSGKYNSMVEMVKKAADRGLSGDDCENV